MMDRWNASKLKAWHRCHRRFRHEFVDGIDAGRSDIADFGTAFHNRCENRLLAAMDRPRVAPVVLPDLFETARLDALWTGYEARWEDDTAWRVLGAEVPFEYELGGHVINSSKGMDGLVQDADGKVYVLEHKTTGADVSGGAAYWERLALDVQVSVYIDACEALGYDCAGVIYDVVSRPRHERKMATPEEDRTLTKGKGCRVCGGKASGVQGSGRRITPTSPGPHLHEAGTLCSGCWCPACGGSGWEEAPRLHKGQRDTDETPDDFYARVVTDIAERPDDFYTRMIITRTEAQKQRGRQSILDTIKLARLAEVVDVFPMNDAACFAYNSKCPFYDACTGAADINDRNRFPLRTTLSGDQP